MRDNGRWHLNDGQRIFVALAVTIALFLGAMSWGMESPTVLGVALLLLVLAGLGVFLLGLRYNGREPLHGSGYVVNASVPPAGSIVGKCHMRLLVKLPGMPSRTIKLRDSATPVDKWPRVGTTLPLSVDPGHGRHLRVRWDLVQPHYVTAPGPANAATADRSAEPSPPPSEPQASHDVAPAPFYTDYVDPPSDHPDVDDALLFRPPPRELTRADARALPPGESSADGPIADELPPSDLPPGEPAVVIRAQPLPWRGAYPGDVGDGTDRARSTARQPRGLPTPRAAEAPPGRTSERANGEAMGITLIVSDLSRSLRFYTGMLGFTVIDRASGSAVLGYGPARVLLRQVADMSPVDQRMVRVHIQVPDVEAAYRTLKARGASFAHRPRMTNRGERLDLWAATLRDPDGHDIELTQWRPRAGGGLARTQDAAPDVEQIDPQ